MKSKKQWKRLTLLYVMLLTCGSVLALGVYSKMRPPSQDKQKGPQTYKAEKTKLSQLPEVTSKVKDLQIAGVSVTGEGTEFAELQIGIINNSDKAVVFYESPRRTVIISATAERAILMTYLM